MRPAVNLDWSGMLGQPDMQTAMDESAAAVAVASGLTEAPTLSPFEYDPRKDPERFAHDGRRWCSDCQRLAGGIRCKAPASGLLVASRIYEPVQIMPRRCIAYLPGPNDPDQTPGAVRWPWL